MIAKFKLKLQTNRLALKEWAVVVRALTAGAQAAILDSEFEARRMAILSLLELDVPVPPPPDQK